MSTIKSSAEHLTLNADGASKDIKFQANGVEKASISSSGAFTSTTIDATALTGTIPNFTSTGIDDNATETAITIDASENVGIGVTPESTNMHSSYTNIDISRGGAIAGHSAGNGIKMLGNSYRTASGYAYKNTDKASLYANDDGLHEFKVAASGTADAAITWTTGFEVLNDGKARAKNGLLFGTDTAAANTLDDYEEGSWTPTANGNLTLSASGRYTKIGNQVIARANIDYTGGTFDGTSLTISGLPFTSSTNAATRSVGAIMANQVNVDTGTYALISYITTGVTTLKCYQSVDNGGWDSLLHSNLSTDSHMYITTTYEI